MVSGLGFSGLGFNGPGFSGFRLQGWRVSEGPLIQTPVAHLTGSEQGIMKQLNP